MRFFMEAVKNYSIASDFAMSTNISHIRYHITE
jgi:hypothetical protein